MPPKRRRKVIGARKLGASKSTKSAGDRDDDSPNKNKSDAEDSSASGDEEESASDSKSQSIHDSGDEEATKIKAIAMRTMAKVIVRMDLGQLLRT